MNFNLLSGNLFYDGSGCPFEWLPSFCTFVVFKSCASSHVIDFNTNSNTNIVRAPQY